MQKVRIWGARAGQLLPCILPQIRACREAGRRVLLLVPEQYTLQAEMELVSGLQLPGLMDVDVLSPRRLTRRIREAGGHGGLTPMDDRGRSMAISRALTLTQDELTYYGRVALTPGLPDKISALIADLQRVGLTPEALLNHSESLKSGALKAKEADLARVWQTYLTVIEGRFADETMQQQDVRRRLKASGVVDGADLFVYGFDVLPQPMCELLAEAAPLMNSLTVAMTMDAKEVPDGRIFLTQRRSAAELMVLLQEKGVPVEWRYLPSQQSHADAALQHVEKYLFTRREAPFAGDSSAVQVHQAPNPYLEAAHAAAALRQWHEEGMPWGRMAVAMADLNALGGILAVTLENAGIPYYVARKDQASRHGLCRLLLGALRSATGGYATQDVLHMAKSGFSPLAVEETCQLENYALENGVNRGKWTKPFTRGAAEEMEPLRQRLMAPVERLHQRLRDAQNAEQSVEAVYGLLEETGAYRKLQQREEELLRSGMAAEAVINRQVWQFIMGLLDQLYALLGGKRAAMKELARYAEAGITGAQISSLPPQPDVVMLGEAGHLMTGRIDALILCGMQEGVLGSSMSSLITEAERRTLSDAMHRAIGLTRQETAALRQSDFYRTVSLPGRKLLVTCSMSGQDGTSLKPSGMIDDLKALFPQLVITGGVSAGEETPLSPQMALDGLAVRLRAMADGTLEQLDERWADALRRLWRDEKWHERIRQVIARATAGGAENRLPPAQTRQLFTQDKVSISRLERFAACPYQHYVDYGLKPVKREKFDFEASDAGDFYHAALQGFARAAMERDDWPELPDEDVEHLMDQVLQPLTSQWADGPLTDTPAQRLRGEKYVRTVKRAAWLFTQHARRSRFATVGEEVVFGEDSPDSLPPVVLTLQDGRRIALRGKIDRIDRWQGDEGVYLRVIDYKSSKRGIDPTRLWYGLQLQLMLYLQAASQGLEGNPAGAFYFTVKDPMVEAEDVKEAAEKAIARQLRLEGVVLADVQVVEAMDTASGYSLGSIFTKSGGLYSNAPAYSPEEMSALLEHAREVAALMADGIREGDISVSPAEIKDWSACQWCEYQAVCGMDPSLPGCTKRVLPHMNRQELLKRLANETITDGFDAPAASRPAE